MRYFTILIALSLVLGAELCNRQPGCVHMVCQVAPGTEKPESLGIGRKGNKQILKVWWEKCFRGTKQGEPAASSTAPLCYLKIRAGLWLDGIMGWGDDSEGEVFTEQV